MVIIFYLLILMILSFFLRLIFFIDNSSKQSDDSSHLWMVKERSQYKDLRQHNVSNTPLVGIRGYPPLSHFLTGLFPERYWSVAGKLLNLLYDCFSVLVVFFSAYFVFGNLWQVKVDVAFAAFITALLYSTTPVLFPVTARLQAMGARTLGLLLTNLFLVFYAIGHVYSVKWPYLFCILLILLILIGSQFAMQNITWICIFLSVVNLSFLPISLYLMGLLISLLPVFDGKKLLLRKYALLIQWYRPYIKRNRKEGLGIEKRNKLKDIIQLPNYIFKNFHEAFLVIARNNSFLIAAYSLPVLFIFTYFMVSHIDEHFLFNDWTFVFGFQLITASILIFLLTSSKYLLFLGEAERYFEFTLFPLNLLTVFLVFESSKSPLQVFIVLFSINILIICFLFIATHYGIFILNLKSKPDHNLLELVSFLEKLDSPKIIALPTKFAFKLSLFLGDKASYYYDWICNPNTGYKYMSEEYTKHYCFLPNFNFYYQKYGIDTFVFSLSGLETAKLQGVNYDLSSLVESFSNKSYWVGRYPGT